MSDDLPTVPLNQPDEPSSPGAPPPAPVERRPNRTALIALGVLAGLLLIAVVVLLTLLLSGRLSADEPTPVPSPSTSDEPSASPEPSEEPSDDVDATTEPTTEPTQTSEPPAPPPPPPAIITSYSASPKSVDCSGGGPVPVTFSWNTSGAKVSFGVGTEFADSQPFATDQPPAGSITHGYQCGQSGSKQIYSIAVFDSGNNVIARQTLTVTETG